MQLMNKDTSITERTPAILETPDHFIINTQVYDKQTLKPISMKFANLLHNNFISVILNTSVQNIYYENNVSGSYWPVMRQRIGNYKNIIKDKYDENLFYLLYKINNNNLSAIAKIRKNNNEYIVEKALTSCDIRVFGNYNFTWSDLKILYETDTAFIISLEVLCWHCHPNAYHYECYAFTIGSLNKNTFTYSEIRGVYDYGNVQHYFMEAKDDLIYILEACNNNYTIFKINISSFTHTQVGDAITGTNYVVSNPIKINDYYYVIFDNYNETSGHRYGFKKIKLDINNDTMTNEIVEIINYDSYKMDSSSDNSLPYGFEVSHQLQTFESNGHVYVECTIYGLPSWIDKPYQCKHVLLELKEDGFYIKQIIPLTDGVNGVLFINEDYKKPVFIQSNYACLFYSFNEDTQEFVQIFKLGGTFISAGFDTLGRFIAQHTNGAVEIFSETNASILKADFNDEIYNLDDKQEIDTTVSFFAKNYLDEYIETSVKLTLIGPVIFKENNKNTLSISTLKSGIRTVPVTITGNGNIEVIITQNT